MSGGGSPSRMGCWGDNHPVFSTLRNFLGHGTFSAKTGKSWQIRTSWLLKVLQNWWSGGKRARELRVLAREFVAYDLGPVWGEREVGYW